MPSQNKWTGAKWSDHDSVWFLTNVRPHLEQYNKAAITFLYKLFPTSGHNNNNKAELVEFIAKFNTTNTTPTKANINTFYRNNYINISARSTSTWDVLYDELGIEKGDLNSVRQAFGTSALPDGSFKLKSRASVINAINRNAELRVRSQNWKSQHTVSASKTAPAESKTPPGQMESDESNVEPIETKQTEISDFIPISAPDPDASMMAAENYITSSMVDEPVYPAVQQLLNPPAPPPPRPRQPTILAPPSPPPPRWIKIEDEFSRGIYDQDIFTWLNQEIAENSGNPPSGNEMYNFMVQYISDKLRGEPFTEAIHNMINLRTSNYIQKFRAGPVGPQPFSQPVEPSTDIILPDHAMWLRNVINKIKDPVFLTNLKDAFKRHHLLTNDEPPTLAEFRTHFKYYLGEHINIESRTHGVELNNTEVEELIEAVINDIMPILSLEEEAAPVQDSIISRILWYFKLKFKTMMAKFNSLITKWTDLASRNDRATFEESVPDAIPIDESDPVGLEMSDVDEIGGVPTARRLPTLSGDVAETKIQKPVSYQEAKDISYPEGYNDEEVLFDADQASKEVDDESKEVETKEPATKSPIASPTEAEDVGTVYEEGYTRIPVAEEGEGAEVEVDPSLIPPREDFEDVGTTYDEGYSAVATKDTAEAIPTPASFGKYDSFKATLDEIITPSAEAYFKSPEFTAGRNFMPTATGAMADTAVFGIPASVVDTAASYMNNAMIVLAISNFAYTWYSTGSIAEAADTLIYHSPKIPTGSLSQSYQNLEYLNLMNRLDKEKKGEYTLTNYDAERINYQLTKGRITESQFNDLKQAQADYIARTQGDFVDFIESQKEDGTEYDSLMDSINAHREKVATDNNYEQPTEEQVEPDQPEPQQEQPKPEDIADPGVMSPPVSEQPKPEEIIGKEKFERGDIDQDTIGDPGDILQSDDYKKWVAHNITEHGTRWNFNDDGTEMTDEEKRTLYETEERMDKIHLTPSFQSWFLDKQGDGSDLSNKSEQDLVEMYQEEYYLNTQSFLDYYNLHTDQTQKGALDNYINELIDGNIEFNENEIPKEFHPDPAGIELPDPGDPSIDNDHTIAPPPFDGANVKVSKVDSLFNKEEKHVFMPAVFKDIGLAGERIDEFNLSKGADQKLDTGLFAFAVANFVTKYGIDWTAIIDKFKISQKFNRSAIKQLISDSTSILKEYGILLGIDKLVYESASVGYDKVYQQYIELSVLKSEYIANIVTPLSKSIGESTRLAVLVDITNMGITMQDIMDMGVSSTEISTEKSAIGTGVEHFMKTPTNLTIGDIMTTKSDKKHSKRINIADAPTYNMGDFHQPVLPAEAFANSFNFKFINQDNNKLKRLDLKC